MYAANRPLLVERRTFHHMCNVRDSMQKKSNGENMIRIVLLCIVFFILLQMFHQNATETTKEEDEDKLSKHWPLSSIVSSTNS
tara:strand:+ start:81 stop:329 length:249 start_codon:yes stop_codon:yes gene_type:complete